MERIRLSILRGMTHFNHGFNGKGFGGDSCLAIWYISKQISSNYVIVFEWGSVRSVMCTGSYDHMITCHIDSIERELGRISTMVDICPSSWFTTEGGRQLWCCPIRRCSCQRPLQGSSTVIVLTISVAAAVRSLWSSSYLWSMFMIYGLWSMIYDLWSYDF